MEKSKIEEKIKSRVESQYLNEIEKWDFHISIGVENSEGEKDCVYKLDVLGLNQVVSKLDDMIKNKINELFHEVRTPQKATINVYCQAFRYYVPISFDFVNVAWNKRIEQANQERILEKEALKKEKDQEYHFDFKEENYLGKGITINIKPIPYGKIYSRSDFYKPIENLIIKGQFNVFFAYKPIYHSEDISTTQHTFDSLLYATDYFKKRLEALNYLSENRLTTSHQFVAIFSPEGELLNSKFCESKEENKSKTSTSQRNDDDFFEDDEGNIHRRDYGIDDMFKYIGNE